MEKAYLQRIYWQLTGVIMAAVIIALAGLSYFSQRAFERELVPEVAREAATVGASVRALILKAVDYGIEYRALYGVEKAFEDVHGENPAFNYVAATDENGRILFQSGIQPAGTIAYVASGPVVGAVAQPNEVLAPVLIGDQYIVSLPIVAGEKPLGMLHIGIDQGFVQNIMLEVLLDVVVVLVVALFFTLELLNFMAGAPLAAGLAVFTAAIARVKRGDFGSRLPLGHEDEIGRVLKHVDAAIARLNDRYQELVIELRNRLNGASEGTREKLRNAVAACEALRERFKFAGEAPAETESEGAFARIRAPLFTFILAEELTRSFLPSYINLLLVPVPGISPQVVIGLPIVLFMLIVALGQPHLGAWSERAGRRRAMLIGAAIGTAGFLATALAQNLLDLLLWRSLCAVGYAIVFVAAQGYVLDHTRPHNRTQGFALFVGAIMVATICGPSIGGILADNIGYRLSFSVSAVLCALSMLTIRMLPQDERRAAERRSEAPPKLADFATLLVNRRFMTLSGLAAIPAKIILTGFCFYLVPLYVVSIGSTQAMAGRMLMVYAVMMVLIVPVAARVADVGARRERLVALGLCISGLAGLLLLASSNFLVIFGVVFLLGLGQALSIAAQSALVGELCREEVQRYGDGPVYGVYRLLERLGNAAGPLLAGILVVQFSYQGAFVAISALVLASGILFTLATGAYRRSSSAPG